MPEVCGDEMSVGMTKFYRVACFREIGGFVRAGHVGRHRLPSGPDARLDRRECR